MEQSRSSSRFAAGPHFCPPDVDQLRGYSKYLLAVHQSRRIVCCDGVEHFGMFTLYRRQWCTEECNAQDDLANCLSLAKKLRTVHINSPIDASTDVYPFVLKVERALSIIKRCNSALSQFGCNSKVWQVRRLTLVGNTYG